MKKMIMVVLMMLLALTSVYGQKKSEEKQDGKIKKEQVRQRSGITKTYVLKHVAPSRVVKVVKPYLFHNSWSDASMMMTLVMPIYNQKKVEEIIKVMDVKKQNIELTIYSIIGSTVADKNKDSIDNKNLINVLEKLKNLLSFKSFRLDGVSFLSLKDGQRSSKIQLSSKNNYLDLYIRDVLIKGDKKAGRSVKFNLMLSRLINTDTSVKENGYLVAGVSKIGKNGDSLILVMSAKIVD